MYSLPCKRALCTYIHGAQVKIPREMKRPDETKKREILPAASFRHTQEGFWNIENEGWLTLEELLSSAADLSFFSLSPFISILFTLEQN